MFDDKKNCDYCGECDVCDLDKNKVCDNCGKCLGENIYETKAVKVDEIIEEDDDEIENDSVITESISSKEEKDTDSIELIDDIEGLRELLESKMNAEKYTVEEFPGLIRLKKDS